MRSPASLDPFEARHFLNLNQSRQSAPIGREYFDAEVNTWLADQLVPAVRKEVGADRWRYVSVARTDYPHPHADWERWYAVTVCDGRRYLQLGLYVPRGAFAAGTAGLRLYVAVDLHGSEINRLAQRVQRAFGRANCACQILPREREVRTFWTDLGEVDFARVSDSELASRIAPVLRELIDALREQSIGVAA